MSSPQTLSARRFRRENAGSLRRGFALRFGSGVEVGQGSTESRRGTARTTEAPGLARARFLLVAAAVDGEAGLDGLFVAGGDDHEALPAVEIA